jgi:nitrate reductase NapAB chaperone NapD
MLTAEEKTTSLVILPKEIKSLEQYLLRINIYHFYTSKSADKIIVLLQTDSV